MKNPNGYGTIRKLSGKQREPWATLTPAHPVPDIIGNQRELIGCYETRAESMKALGIWHESKSPISSPCAEKITLNELYKEYILLPQFTQLSQQTKDCYHAAWLRLYVLGKLKVKDIRTPHFQSIIDEAVKKVLSYSTLHKTKAFAGLLCDYAVQSDTVNKNYASFVVLPKEEKTEKVPFNDIELHAIEKAAQEGFTYADLILIMCYTGWRVSEFLSLTPFSYDAENKALTGGCKTEAGRNRTIPISPKIQPFVDKWLAKKGPYIVCQEYKGELVKVTPNYFRRYWYFPTLEALGLPKLTPHTTRHTFASILHRAGANKWDIQRLMGHQQKLLIMYILTLKLSS